MTGKGSDGRTLDAIGLIDSLDLDAVEQQVNDLKSKLRALEILLKAKRAASGVEPPKRKPRQKRPAEAGAVTSSTMTRVIRYLDHRGPSKPAVIAADLGLPTNVVGGLLGGHPDKFEQVALGWKLRNE